MNKLPFFDAKKTLTRIASNWPAKVLSIGLAIFLVVSHQMNLLENRFFSVPLKIEASGNMVPASSYPRMVRVTLRGEANGINPILEDDIEAYLDLSKHTVEGSYKAPVQIRKLGTALGVEPLEVSVDPMEVSLELDQKISKYVPVSPGFQGYLEAGYELVSYTLTPTQVVVDGPLRLMSGLSELSTDAIELGGRSDDFTINVRILNRDPLLVIRGEGLTEFRGMVRKLIIIRSFEDLSIRLEGLDKAFIGEMAVNTGSVRLEGTQNELESYQPGADILYLDCSTINAPGMYTLQVQAAVPASFTLIRSDPSYVTVRVRPLNSDDEGGGDGDDEAEREEEE
jgi:YbbR domain-containing protein